MPKHLTAARSSQPVRPPFTALLLGAAALVLVTGCGGSGSSDEDGKESDVASIGESARPEKSPAGGKTNDEPGVQLRLDTSEEEHQRISNAWAACLKKEGVPTYEKGGWVFPQWEDPAMPKATKACAELKPINPPEKDPDKNPNYLDDFRESIRCMNERGLKVKGMPDGSGWNYVGEPPPDHEKIQADCELEAFGDE
ncbi:hypothetical protein [Streptomyces sp. YS415]|uniref:hypothetical protein n=1 Tax=Streptomyces sp. YS415 TaxID=2944806 RepID=UPI00201FFD81|nr:hypothetical protein [Streptomyces sp. YS415]MCL7430319.1 hypothetical protein [Streptomyces sp. YS415]